MDKNTIIAIALSLLVMVGTIFVQRTFFPGPQAQGGSPAPSPARTEAPASPGAFPAAPVRVQSPALEIPSEERLVVIETARAVVTLSSRGGDVVSYRLREHREGDDNVEMIYAGSAEKAHAFTVAFGDRAAAPLTENFMVNRLGDYEVEFYRDYAVSAPDGGENRFRLGKRYKFIPDEYMFELAVTLDGGHEIPSLAADGGPAYTLAFGPQIGPRFQKLDGRSDFRRYITFANGKRRDEKIREGVPLTSGNHLSWAAVAGKYFTLIAVPDATAYTYTYLQKADEAVGTASLFYMGRPALGASKTTDVYRFYLGPKNQSSLSIYDTGVNAFNLRDMELSRAASSSGILAPVEAVLKWGLTACYKLLRNWGLAIILLTLIVKIVLFPLTYKSSEGTMRMQAISPRIKELQEKYKGDQNQLNMKMMELYKQEGYNPMSGCITMLIQFPILIAMYNLFANHFDLRGAMFIPGWIPDLSAPESVWNFAPVRLPLLGSDIRLLPFLYVGSQLLSSKITQTPDQQSNPQMKMMLYLMPVMFFFLLYNMPSGLTVYWIMTNIFSLIQQLMINQYLRRKKEAAGEAPRPVIAPGGGGKGGSRKRKKR
ncbi:MAG: membrane protein insertase YidC [Spirochaetaceae bacterium]|jgi:YidC/Oxa1 family membrane protein insertase|nr:membrane protein insertase YidC [Spirochaetaceae bacterium]